MKKILSILLLILTSSNTYCVSLIDAIYENNECLVEEALRQPETNVNAINFSRGGTRSALMLAVENDNPQIVRLLLKDPKLNINDMDGAASALILAASLSSRFDKPNNSEILKLLLKDLRTDINKENYLGRTALDYAKEYSAANKLIKEAVKARGL